MELQVIDLIKAQYSRGKLARLTLYEARKQLINAVFPVQMLLYFSNAMEWFCLLSLRMRLELRCIKVEGASLALV